jgi:hypothetical protein
MEPTANAGQLNAHQLPVHHNAVEHQGGDAGDHAHEHGQG